MPRRMIISWICVLSQPTIYDLGVIRAEFIRHFTIDLDYHLKNPYTLSLQNSYVLGTLTLAAWAANPMVYQWTDFRQQKQNISNSQTNKLTSSYIPHGLRYIPKRGTKKSLTLFSSSDSFLNHGFSFWSSTSSPAKQSPKPQPLIGDILIRVSWEYQTIFLRKKKIKLAACMDHGTRVYRVIQGYTGEDKGIQG